MQSLASYPQTDSAKPQNGLLPQFSDCYPLKVGLINVSLTHKMPSTHAFWSA